MTMGFSNKSDPELGDWLELELTKYGADRHAHGFRYYPDEHVMIIDCLFVRGLETVSEAKLISNHNGLGSGALAIWRELINSLNDPTLKVWDPDTGEDRAPRVLEVTA